MAETFYNLLNSQAFWVVIAAWAFVCIAWTERWKPVLGRLGKLFLKPVIFKKDPDPNNLPFYPRDFMEESASGFRDTLRKPFSDIITFLSEWFGNRTELIYSREHAFRTLGYILFLVSFLFFILADSIAVANTLVVLNLWAGELPDLLGRFDIAVFGGSLLALIIGMVLVFEMQSANSEFSRWSDRDIRTKALARAIAFLVTLLSLITLIAWALFRLIELGRLDSNPILDGALNWVLFGLVPINSALAAAISFPEAMIGFLVIIVFVGWVAVGILYLLDYVATIIGSIAPYLFDISYRLIYVVVDLLQWFISTPVQLFLLPFRLIAGMVSGVESDDSRKKK